MWRNILSFPWAASDTKSIEASKFPARGANGKHVYLRALRMRFSGTITASAAVSAAAMYNMLMDAVTLSTPGGAWGPDNLSGTDLAAKHILAANRRVRTVGNGGGAIVGAGAAPKDIVFEFRFDDIGLRKTDLSPAIQVLQKLGSSLNIRTGALAAGVDSVAGNVRIDIQTDETKEQRVVPRVTVARVGLDMEKQATIGRGRVAFIALRKTAIADINGKVTELTVRADGVPVIDRADPKDFVAEGVAPNLLSEAYQPAFCDHTNDGGLLYQRLFPALPEQSLTKLPEANVFSADFTFAGITAAECQLLVATIHPLSPSDMATQSAHVAGTPTADGDALAAKVKTFSKVASVNPANAGILPLKIESRA